MKKFYLLLLFVLVVSFLNFSRPLIFEVKQLQNRTLSLPTKVKIISSDLKSNQCGTFDYKIVTYIDLDCEACWADLILWQEYWRNNHFQNVEFLCYIYAHNYHDVLQKLNLRNIVSFPLLFDVDNQFLQNNSFLDSKQFQTLLVDRNNKIILIGNPATKEAINTLYCKLLLPSK